MFVDKNHKLFILTVFVSAHVVNDFYVTVLPAFLPALSDEFNLDYGELGILSLTFTLLSGVLQPLLGHRADRHGERRLILSVGFLVGAVGFVAMAAAPSFWFLIAVSLLCGLGGASYHPQATAFIVSRYPDDRGRMLGIHGWGGSVGHFLAPAAVTISVAAFSWRFSMLVIALPLALMALFLRFSLEESEPSSSATLTGVMTKQLIRVAVAFGLLSVVMRSFLTFAVKMLVDEGWTGQGAGLALSSVLLVGTLAQPIGGRIYDRIGGRTVFIYAIVGTILSVACFAVTSGAMSLAAIALISLFGFSLFPVSLAYASQLAGPKQTGAAVGAVFGVSGLMSALAQPVVGTLAEQMGSIRGALSWLIVVALAAFPIAFTLPKHGE